MAVRDLDNDGSAFLQNFDTAMLGYPAQSVWRLQRSALYVTRRGFGAFPDYTVRLSTQVEGTDHSPAVSSGRCRLAAQIWV